MSEPVVEPTASPAEPQADAPGDAPQYVSIEDFRQAMSKAQNDMQAQFGRVFKALESASEKPVDNPPADGSGEDPYVEERERLQAESQALRDQRDAMHRQQVRQGLIGVMRAKGVDESMVNMAVDSIMLRHGAEFTVEDNGLGEAKVLRKAGEFAEAQTLDLFGSEYLAGNRHLLPSRETGNIPSDGKARDNANVKKISMDQAHTLTDAELASGDYEIVMDSLAGQFGD